MAWFSASRGFTLIELMVVMAILAVVAALMTPNIRNEVNYRRANVSIQETQLIIDSARTYRMQKGVWPGDATCSDALAVLSGGGAAYLVGIQPSNKYNSPFSTSCTAYTFSLDQNALPDWDGYIANAVAGTEIVSEANSQIRTTIGIPGSEPALDAKLSRIATGNAELNRMRTNLLLGGNDINEVNNLNASSGSFSDTVNTQTLTVQLLASIAGNLAVQGESQFTGKSRFKQEIILDKVVSEGQTGCTTGAIARNTEGKTLSCQNGTWKSNGGIDGPYQVSGSSLGKWAMCTLGNCTVLDHLLAFDLTTRLHSM